MEPGGRDASARSVPSRCRVARARRRSGAQACRATASAREARAADAPAPGPARRSTAAGTSGWRGARSRPTRRSTCTATISTPPGPRSIARWSGRSRGATGCCCSSPASRRPKRRASAARSARRWTIGCRLAPCRRHRRGARRPSPPRRRGRALHHPSGSAERRADHPRVDALQARECPPSPPPRRACASSRWAGRNRPPGKARSGSGRRRCRHGWRAAASRPSPPRSPR